MEYETEEQQVEALKEWWSENGRAVIAGVVLGVGVIGGWSLWQKRAESQAIAASDGYSLAMEAVEAGDQSKAISLADELRDDHPKSLYAAYGNLAAARAHVEADELDKAAERLAWVADKAPQEDVRIIAAVRHARVLGAMGDASKGLDSLPKSFPESFSGLVEEARGDLLVQTGDMSGARSAYEAAQQSQHVSNPEALTMKLNELAAAESAS